MAQDFTVGIAFSLPVGDREGDGYTDNKHESGLYQVPEVNSLPSLMAELGTDELENTVPFHLPKQPDNPGVFDYQDKHDKTTKKIYGSNSFWNYGAWIGNSFIHLKIFPVNVDTKID